MKTLHILTATAGVLLTLTASSLAAPLTSTPQHDDSVNTVRTYGERDMNNPPWPHRPGYGAYARGAPERPRAPAPALDQPYSYSSDFGEEYGGPNSW